MSDVEFCIRQLELIAEMHTQAPDKLQQKLLEFLKVRMPPEQADRDRLRAWAKQELAKLELPAGSGFTRPVHAADLALTSRRMSMLQVVIEQIEAFDAASKAGNAA